MILRGWPRKLPPRLAAPLLGLHGGVSRGDGLHGVRGDLCVELGDLARLRNEALVRLLGEVGLNLDRGLEAASAEKLLERGRAGLERLLRIVGRFRRRGPAGPSSTARKPKQSPRAASWRNPGDLRNLGWWPWGTPILIPVVRSSPANRLTMAALCALHHRSQAFIALQHKRGAAPDGASPRVAFSFAFSVHCPSYLIIDARSARRRNCIGALNDQRLGPTCPTLAPSR